MKHLILFSLISFSVMAHAQITVDTLVKPEDLIKKVLLGGNDVKVGNIKYTGHISAAGYFENANDAFSIEKGIVLSTGRATSVIGPNSTANKSELLYTYGDQDLSDICGKTTFDAAVLEFDFVPLSNKVSFQYVFASEEYPEYSGSKFNDVFAFFISGPAIDGQKNMAIVPHTNEIVSINTISQFKNTDYFIDNNAWKLDGKRKHDVGLGFLNQDLLQTSEFDGMTVVLTAQTNVVPFKKYHFKMAIADVSDKKYNSAVFLKGGSFKAELDTTASEIFLTSAEINKDDVDIDAILNDHPLNKPEFISKSLDNSPPKAKGVVASEIPREYDNLSSKKFKEAIFAAPKNEIKPIENNTTLILPAFFEAIRFENASYELSEHSKNVLKSLVKMLESTPEAKVKLSGHTCSNGSNEDNFILSENRAKAVQAFLMEEGINASRIELAFYGEEMPLMKNHSQKGKENNRRVEILLKK